MIAMNLRPRCETFLPLATQQMRLRSLVRIQGVNISCSDHEESLIYYTLHYTKDGEAFYRSEALPQRNQQKWAEISCNEMRKSNANCVCVKIWAHRVEVNTHKSQMPNESGNRNEKECKETTSAFSNDATTQCLVPHSGPRPPDELLFTWGVYFSGLFHFNQQSEAKCSRNSLLFQINGDFFGSPEHFTIECLREQLLLNYQQYSASVPKTTSGHPDDDEFCINSPQVSRSSTPPPDASDWEYDLLRMAKTRYTLLNFARKSVRKSYNLEKLLRIQELQRIGLQRKRESLEIASEIRQISVRCITKEQSLRKPRTTSLSTSSFLHHHYHNQHHSMGRALSVLLAEQQQIDPKVLLRAQELEKQIETMRCKQRLLQSERDTYTDRISQMRQHLNSLSQSRLHLESWLERHTRQLQNEQDDLRESYQQQLALSQAKRHIVQNVERRMSSLCLELREIYPIERSSNGIHTICGIPVPNMDAYMNDLKYASSIGVENISPMALSASLGYIAHLAQMISVIINRPLRNPIICEGSKSRIVDNVKAIPFASREFPLYSRSTLPSKLVKYAIILLNQNIAQLCFDITGIRCDPRATVENIILIFTTLAEVEQSEQPHDTYTRSHTHPNNRLTLPSPFKGTTESLKCDSVDCLSKSYSSANVTSLLHMVSSQPMPIIERDLMQQRISRSVGSYSDCEDNLHDTIDQFHSNSDSNIPTFNRGEI